MKIYKHVHSTENFKRFLIPKSPNSNNEIWAEISIDYPRQKFVSFKRRLIQPNEIEWKIYEGGTFPSSLFNDFLSSPLLDRVKWDYIGGWENSGKLTPELLVKWAYVENGFFKEQDEDLLMHDWSLIITMHDLMIDEYSNRKEDLNKILKSYAKSVFKNMTDLKAIEEFNKIKSQKIDNAFHHNLIEYLEEISIKSL